MQGEIATIVSERSRVAEAIASMGYKPVPSAANFILFSGFTDEASAVWQRLLNQGILIRDIGLRGYLRVTIGTPAENDQFIAALRGITE